MFCAILMIAVVALFVILEVLITVMIGEGDSRFWDDPRDEDGSDPRR